MLSLFSGAVAAATLAGAAPAASQAPIKLPVIVAKQPPAPDIIVDNRLRYEFVDQEGLAEQARALTLRTRLGFETPELAGVRVLLEVENLTALLDEYNDTLNGKRRFPVVSDPEGAELNRAQVTWSGLPKTEVVLGRQRVALNNARFIGNSGYRQREQTFDAVRVENTALGPVTLSYIYLDRVLRVVGRDSPLGEYDSDSHLLQAEAETPWGEAVVYSYLVDLKNAPVLSAATHGARLEGTRSLIGDTAFTYAAEYARQSDYGSQPHSFDLDYLALEGGLEGEAWSAVAGMERLGGDGRTGLITALGSSHGPQGWSDAILSAPPEGLLDLNVTGAVEWKGAPIGQGLRFTLAAFRFTDEGADRDLGSELNASVGTKLTRRLSAEVKAAVFDGETPAYADRTKVWASTELKF